MYSSKKILVPVDFSERCAAALRYARELALRFDSEVILAHVLPPLHAEFGLQIEGSMLVEVYRARAEQAERELEVFEQPTLAGLKVRRLILHGDPSARIVECAREEAVGLIAMPTHGPRYYTTPIARFGPASTLKKFRRSHTLSAKFCVQSTWARRARAHWIGLRGCRGSSAHISP